METGKCKGSFELDLRRTPVAAFRNVDTSSYKTAGAKLFLLLYQLTSSVSPFLSLGKSDRMAHKLLSFQNWNYHRLLSCDSY